MGCGGSEEGDNEEQGVVVEEQDPHAHQFQIELYVDNEAQGVEISKKTLWLAPRGGESLRLQV